MRAGDRLVVSDIPLLFEAADPGEFDAIVLVDAPEETRLARLMEHRGLDAGRGAADDRGPDAVAGKARAERLRHRERRRPGGAGARREGGVAARSQSRA